MPEPTKKLFIVPVDGRKVRDPATRVHLPGTGAWKPRTRYWLRRIVGGDVVEAPPPEHPKSEKES
jgi:hypothetical protein